MRKKQAIIDIKELNNLIIFYAYLISLQLEIINDFKNCTHISIFDVNAFFINDECIQKIHTS